jgi:hypothetical protein
VAEQALEGAGREGLHVPLTQELTFAHTYV